MTDITRLIDEVIDREGGYSNHPADRGGPTNWGITQAVARQHGYMGDMRHFPRAEAVGIYRRLYWLRPAFDLIAQRAATLAAEMFDTGVNMGPAVAATFLQRALNALNRVATDYPDMRADGAIGPVTLAALDAFSPRADTPEKPCWLKQSMCFRASAISASPNNVRPTKPFSTAGSPTGSTEKSRQRVNLFIKESSAYEHHNRPDRSACPVDRQDHSRPEGARRRQARIAEA